MDPFGPCGYGRLASVAMGRFGHVLNRGAERSTGVHDGRWLWPIARSLVSSVTRRN
jgi:hypothetical protein